MTDTLHDLMSLNSASAFLRSLGVTRCSRSALLIAIAHGHLRVAAAAQRTTLLQRTELERYAAAVTASGHDKATMSA